MVRKQHHQRDSSGSSRRDPRVNMQLSNGAMQSVHVRYKPVRPDAACVGRLLSLADMEVKLHMLSQSSPS